MVAALAERVPEEDEFDVELDLPCGVPAPVKPTQPERGSSARQPAKKAKTPSGARRLKVCL
jgi:hypothetical protein